MTTFAIEPDVPNDPLAAAESADWARARHLAVLGLPLDDRAAHLLRALEQLQRWIDDPENVEATLDDRQPRTEENFVVAPTDPTAMHGSADEASPAPSDELPQLDQDSAEAIELSVEEVSDADLLAGEIELVPETVITKFAQPQQFATAETIILSGPEIRRKIRHRQSVIPEYVAQVLYEDIGSLFEIGDREGALISLERLLAIAPITPQIDQFLTHNEARLVEYYQTVLGPWGRTARLREGETAMPQGYFKIEKVALIVKHLDGTMPLEEVMARSGLRVIEACAVLSQLARSSSLDLGDKK